MTVDQTTDFDIVATAMVEIFTLEGLHLYKRADMSNFPRPDDGHVMWITANEIHHADGQIDPDNPSIIEIQRRLDAGTASLMYQGHDDDGDVLVPWPDLPHEKWPLLTIFDLHWERNPHEFFDMLARYCHYVHATDDTPAEFHIPGVVIDKGARTYYKRQDSVGTPDIRSMNALAADGWTTGVPYGPQELHSVRVTETPGGSPIVEERQRVYWRRPDVAASLRAIARAWHSYWTGLTSSEQGINTRMTLKKHVEHAIGRAWVDKDFDDDIRVARGQPIHTRPARDTEDWYLGNLEQWAFEWGFPAFAVALSQGGNRGVLESELGDYTFCHINEDGTLGDRLINPADGILEATWTAYGTTYYNAALGTLISVDAGVDQTVGSRVDVVMVSSATVTNAMGTTTYLWEQESGPTQTLLPDNTANTVFAAPRLQVGDDPVVLVFKVTATNNGESASDTITITVNPPPPPEDE